MFHDRSSRECEKDHGGEVHSKFVGMSFITVEMVTSMNKVMKKDMELFCVEGLPVLKSRG
jgi:hypothetical protein